MSCYFIASIKIHDWDRYNKYLEGFDDIFSKYQGKVLAVDDSPILLEGSWDYTRAVIVRFPNVEEAKRWYESDEYQDLVRHRHEASKADIILVKGRE